MAGNALQVLMPSVMKRRAGWSRRGADQGLAQLGLGDVEVDPPCFAGAPQDKSLRSG
jgi:hypothetical protein